VAQPAKAKGRGGPAHLEPPRDLPHELVGRTPAQGVANEAPTQGRGIIKEPAKSPPGPSWRGEGQQRPEQWAACITAPPRSPVHGTPARSCRSCIDNSRFQDRPCMSIHSRATAAPAAAVRKDRREAIDTS